MGWLPKKCVVVPIDFSENCFAAAALALEFVESADQLHIVHVLPKLSPMEPGAVWGDVDNDSRSDHVEGAVRERLCDSELADAAIAVAFGKPAREIAQYAKRVGAELIVMPSNVGHGGKYLLVGSVTERVVHTAHCPVLVLRPE
jgi:nucleotide-binding universal stress UspA family protein